MPRRSLLIAACVLSLAVLHVLPAAAAYSGTFRGTTVQGKPISFVVGAGDRVVALNLAYVLPGCAIEQKVTTSTPIRGGSFAFSLNLPNNKVSVSGRFTSASQAAGTLTASDESGRATTRWTAARAGTAPASTPKAKAKAKAKPRQKPEVPEGPYEGLWEGKVALPAGLDPDVLLEIFPEIIVIVTGNTIESADFPFVILGAGCSTGADVEKEFRPPVKFKGKRFSISFEARGGVEVVLAGTFDAKKRAHGTVRAKGSFGGCDGASTLRWRATNVG